MMQPTPRASLQTPWPKMDLVVRQDLLSQIRETLLRTNSLALLPPEGFAEATGKSALAFTYAERFLTEYSVILWVRGRESLCQIIDYASFSSLMGFPASQDRLLLGNLRASHLWLEQNPGWLLILDGAQSVESHMDFLPQGTGHILVTTRQSDWNTKMATLVVPAFSRSEANEVIPGADALVESLLHAPRSLKMAAWLQKTGHAEQDAGALTERLAKRTETYPHASQFHSPRTGALVSLVKERLAEQSPDALRILQVAPFLSADAPIGPLIRALIQTDDAALKAVDTLTDAGLLAVSPWAVVFSDAVLSALRLQLADDVRKDSLEKATRLLWMAFPAPRKGHEEAFPPSSWPTCDALLPHTMQLLEHVAVRGVCAELAIQLALKVNAYGQQREFLAISDLACSMAMEIARNHLAPTEPLWYDALMNLAGVRVSQRRAQEAIQLYQEVLGHRSTETEPLVVAAIHAAMGHVHMTQAQPAAALTVYERARSLYGSKAPEQADFLRGNLALCLTHLGRFREARSHYEAAIQKQHVERDPHRWTLILLSYVQCLYKLGELRFALQMAEKTRYAVAAIHGPRHPMIGSTLLVEGQVHLAMGNFAKGQGVLAEAVALLEQTLGREHQETRVARTLLEQLQSHPPAPPAKVPKGKRLARR